MIIDVVLLLQNTVYLIKCHTLNSSRHRLVAAVHVIITDTNGAAFIEFHKALAASVSANTKRNYIIAVKLQVVDRAEGTTKREGIGQLMSATQVTLSY